MKAFMWFTSRNSNSEDSGSTSYNVDTYSYLSDDVADVGSKSNKNTTISLTPDETKLKSPVERWSAAIKFNRYGFDSRTSVKCFQHLHLKIFTAKDKIDEGWGVVPPNEMTYLFHAYFLFYCSNFGFAGHVKILKWPKIYTKLQVTFPQNF